MDNLEFLFSMNQGENKANEIVASALQDKLALDEPISKDDVISTIQGIDIGAIVQAVVKKVGIKAENIISYKNTIDSYAYINRVALVNLKLPNATSIGTSAIQNCIYLTNLELPVVSIIKGDAMRDCISLTNLELPKATNIGDNSFRNCISLTNLDVPNTTSIGNYTLTNCISLINLDLPAIASIGNSAMTNCVSLKSLKLVGSEVATLSNTNALLNTPIAKGTGYIYVPDELVEDYKVATNWSVYADQIRPISEYKEEE